jgi:hypothetical protein
MTQNEEMFFISALNTDTEVLEWGSGQSTAQIATRVRSLVSIEHDKTWYAKLRPRLELFHNVDYLFVPPNTPYDEKRDGDGNAEQFKNYTMRPLTLARTFDVILIDGRARIGCAAEAAFVINPDGFIFIHDYDRTAYHEVEKFLKLVDRKENIAKFKVAKFQ